MSAGWTWFFAIAGIVLTFPLSVIGGILAPRIERWWATTTRARAESRLEALGIDIARLKTFDGTSRDEVLSRILKMTFRSLMGMFVALLFSSSALTAVVMGRGSHNPIALHAIVYSCLIMFTGGYFLFWVSATDGLAKVRQLSGSQRNRLAAKLETEMRSLQARLPSYPHAL